MEPNASAKDDRMSGSGILHPEPEGNPGQTGLVEATEQLLLAQLRRGKVKDPRAVWHRLIGIYSDRGNYDKAIWSLRRLTALEPDVEESRGLR